MTETASAAKETGAAPVFIHFLETLSVCVSTSVTGDGRILGYGDEMEITEDVIAASHDRNGNTWLRWLDEGQEEYVREGKVVCRRGMWPEGQSRLAPSSPQWAHARRSAIAQALSTPDPIERQAALQRVDKHFAPVEPTGRTRAEAMPATERGAQ